MSTEAPARRRQLRSSWLLGLLALVLTVPATVALASQDSGLVRAEAVAPGATGVPVTTLVDDASTPHPVVVVVHGFAGSAQLMDDLGVSLARAGYAVVLPDLAGHGRNAAPLPLRDGSVATDTIDADLAAVVRWSAQQPWADQSRLPALVGHSMGAGAVVRYAVASPDALGATVALSLPSADDLPSGSALVPRNLLLLYGANEQQRFVDAALEGLRAAYPDGVVGPGYGAPVDGTARAAQVVPRADHITILFSSDTRQLTIDWLDQTVGAPSSGHDASGSRILWLLVLMAGAAIGFVPLARLLLPERTPGEGGPAEAPRPRAPVALLVSVVGAVVASLAAAALSGVASRVPLAVGGYVLVWFACGGLAVAVLTTLVRRRTTWLQASAPADAPAGAVPGSVLREVVVVLVLTAYAVVALALVGRATWSAFELAGDRRSWLLVVELAFIAWFWADDRLVGSRWWLALLTRVVAVVVLLASVVVLGAPGFLTLLVPLMAVVLGLLVVYGQSVTRRARLPWAAAVVQGVPLAYLVVTTFPLVS
jgi:dienelactone hydrolase